MLSDEDAKWWVETWRGGCGGGEVASVATLPLVTLDTGKDAATEQDWELSCTGLAQWSGGSEPKL